jgi:RimJ/RimL family protein N-acetyltransferase
MAKPLDSLILTTNNLILRPPVLDDFAALSRIWSDPIFCRKGQFPIMGAELVWMRLLRDIGHWHGLGFGSFMICDKRDQELIGQAGLFDYRRDMNPGLLWPEVGWALDPDFHGRGFGFEAMQTVLDLSDKVLRFDATQAIIRPDNHASLKLAARLGYDQRSEASFMGSPALVLTRNRP